MDLNEFLTVNGHFDAVEKIASFKRIRDRYASNWPSAYAAGMVGEHRTLAEYDAFIAECERRTAITYEALIKTFDAENDLAFAALEAEEKLQLIIDDLTAKDPEAGAKFEQFLRDCTPEADDE